MQTSLELAPKPLLFEATSSDSVFFDDGNHQVIVFRTGKMSGLMLNCDANHPAPTTVLCLTMNGHQKILAIKFSLDNKLMAIQRQDKTIEIFRFNPLQPDLNVLLATKKFRQINFKLLGFVWINSVELLVVTNKRMEIYRISSNSNQLELLKTVTFSNNIVWFVWCKVGHLALFASQRGVLTPVLVKHSDTVEKLSPLDKMDAVQKTDVTLTQVYNVRMILILKRKMGEESMIWLYQLDSDNANVFKKTHVLRLGDIGNDVKIQIVDNLIVAHDIELHSTLLFDIGMECEATDNVYQHLPITKQRALSQSQMEQEFDYTISLFFAPNVVVVPTRGHLWHIQLNLHHLCQSIPEPVRLVDILLPRENSKSFILALLRHITAKFEIYFNAAMETIFDKLNRIYKALDVEIRRCQWQKQSCNQIFLRTKAITKVCIKQSDMLDSVLSKITDPKQCENVLLVYLDSLVCHGIPVRDKLSCFVMQNLAIRRNMSTIDHLLRHQTVKDSQSLVDCLLAWSKKDENLQFFQMALDMLARMGDHKRILEVLTEHGKVMDAIFLAMKLDKAHLLDEPKCLAAAQSCPLVQHSVEMFFVERNK